MDTVITYFSEHSFLDLLSALVVIVAIVVCIEKFFKWLWNMFLRAYNRMKGREEEVSTIDKNTSEIKNLSKSIEDLGNLLNKQYQHLDKKIDEQKERLDIIDRDGKRRDVTLMRDRIIQSHRYFSQQRDDEGIVYMSISDFENLQNLFVEYIEAGGNGVVHQIYEQDFLKHFRVDSTSLNLRK